jgi:phage replication O-like protein O
MSSPQTEDGYTRIANELLDAIVQTRIPAEVRRVFDYILRMTYGYSRKSFETTHYEIAQVLKTKRQRVSSSIDWLRSRNMINGTEKCAVLERNHKTILGIQKDFDGWKHGTEKCAAQKSVPSTAQKSVQTSSRKKKENRGELHNGTKKRAVFIPPAGSQLKENGHSWIEETSWNEFVQHRKDIKKPLSDLAVKKSLALLSQFKTRQREIIDASIRNGWQGLFPPKGVQISQQQEIKYSNPNADMERIYGKS